MDKEARTQRIECTEDQALKKNTKRQAQKLT